MFLIVCVWCTLRDILNIKIVRLKWFYICYIICILPINICFMDVKESERVVTQSCLTLWDPVDCSLPDSSIHGIFQARVLEWVAISFSMGLPHCRETLYHPSHQESQCERTINGLLWWLSSKESACRCRRHEFNPWVRKIPWNRKWQPTPVFLPGKSHGERSLVDYSPWHHKESDMT